MRRLFLLILLVALPAYSQSGNTQVFVVATKTAFIWGEPVKVTASVRDNQGVAQNVPVTWQVVPSTAAKIAADGTVTPSEFTSFVVRAQANGVSGEVAMQVIPKKIVVKPEAAVMTVGGTQKVRADALDINDAPVPSARLDWSLLNLMGGWDRSFPMASIDNAGSLHALVAGRLRVVVGIQYDYSPFSIGRIEGEAVVEINPPHTYRVSRLFTGAAARNTSELAPTSSTLIPTKDGFAFVASLDLASSALVEWTPNGIKPIAVSGRAGANRGQPLLQFQNLTSSHGSQFLFSELDTQGSTQISAGSTAYTQPLLVPNSPLFWAKHGLQHLQKFARRWRDEDCAGVLHRCGHTQTGVGSLPWLRTWPVGMDRQFTRRRSWVSGATLHDWELWNRGRWYSVVCLSHWPSRPNPQHLVQIAPRGSHRKNPCDRRLVSERTGSITRWRTSPIFRGQ